MVTWQIECDLEEVSFAAVECVVLALFALSMIYSNSFADEADFSIIP